MIRMNLWPIAGIASLMLSAASLGFVVGGVVTALAGPDGPMPGDRVTFGGQCATVQTIASSSAPGLRAWLVFDSGRGRMVDAGELQAGCLL